MNVKFGRGRGLPAESRIDALRPSGEPFTAWTLDVRKNGLLVVEGQRLVCDRTPCVDGGESQSATLRLPEAAPPQ